MFRKTYIEIDSQNLLHNTATLIKTYSGYQYYIAVVKGNVYGHGSQTAKVLLSSGANYLAVSSLEEALVLRNDGIDTPILLLQPIHLEDIPEAVKNNVTITISNYEYFKKLTALSLEQELKIHLKINSGFNRLGLSDKNQIKEIFETLQEGKNLKLEGIYTHFMTSGRNDSYFVKQVQKFQELTSLLDLKQIPIVHADRSLTLSAHPKLDFCNGVRVGLSLYGYGLSQAKQGGAKGFLKGMMGKNKSAIVSDLKPALSLYSEVIEINKIKKGDVSGYGAAFVSDKDAFIACISIGYADGFFKKNKSGYVFINNQKYKIISVDMGILTALVDGSVKVYDKVELIGQHITAKDIAVICDTSVYEILCALKESLPRILK